MAKVEKTKSGMYRIRVFAGTDAAGKDHWKSFTHSDPKYLKRIAAEYEAERKEYRTRSTMRALIKSYIDAKEPVLSPSTIRGYRALLRALEASYPAFMLQPAGDLRKQNYQAVVAQLSAAGKSPKYIKNMTALISAAMTYYDYKVPQVTIPTRTEAPAELPADRDILNLIIYADDHGLSDLCLAVCLALFCGLRRSEICALERSDLRNGMLTVDKAVVLGADNKWHVKSTKTSQSVRIIPVPDAIREEIERRDGHVISCNPDALRDRFERAIRNSGVKPFTLHQLRHKFASDAMLAGIPDVYIEYIGGWKHGSQVLKRTYQQAEREKAADMLRGMWA